MDIINQIHTPDARQHWQKHHTMEHFYEPAAGHRLQHDPFKAILGPRVIGWISTRSLSGKANLAPYSFFGAFSSQPMMIGFSSEGYKDTVRNAEETGQFVWNYVSQDLAQKMNLTSASVDAQQDEFALADIDSMPAVKVNAPRVAQAPAALECEVVDVRRLQSRTGVETGHWLVLGEVVGVAINPRCLRDGIFDVTLAQPVLRAGYRGDYFTLGEKFEMLRPRGG